LVLPDRKFFRGPGLKIVTQNKGFYFNVSNKIAQIINKEVDFFLQFDKVYTYLKNMYVLFNSLHSVNFYQYATTQ